MKRLYLLLAVAGGILPYIFFIPFFRENGLNMPGFLQGLFANGPAAGFSADLLFTSFVFWVYMIVQGRKSNGPNPVIFILLNLLIGLSCALPAYLYATSNGDE